MGTESITALMRLKFLNWRHVVTGSNSSCGLFDGALNFLINLLRKLRLFNSRASMMGNSGYFDFEDVLEIQQN